MNVLIIGGTGTISTYVVNKCLEERMAVTVMNRGTHNDQLPKGVKTIICDINNEPEALSLLKDKHFDSVIEFVAFTKEQVERDVRLFKGKTNQYIFISTASAYQKPVEDYPITENTPLINPYWDYSQRKIECEAYLSKVKDMNITVVRPSHTYDNKMIMAVMIRWGNAYAHIKRLKEHKPIIIPGDGTSVWTITHASDFANSFVYLIGNAKTYGEAYHITGNRLYTWEQLSNILAKELHVTPHYVHIPTDIIVKHMPEMKGPLMGDKAWSAIFDNTKIKKISKSYTSIVGYEDVAVDVIKYFETHQEAQNIDDEYEKQYDGLINDYLIKHPEEK